MKKESEELLAKEYINKVKCCDECFCEMFCIENGLRKGRKPYSECYKNVLGNMQEKENTRIKDSEYNERLIYASEMREFVLRQMRNDNIYCANDFLDVIDEQPTVDAVHVVRCKDCIHWRKYDKETMCAAISSDPYEAWASEANDYCSLGERKDGEGGGNDDT